MPVLMICAGILLRANPSVIHGHTIGTVLFVFGIVGATLGGFGGAAKASKG